MIASLLLLLAVPLCCNMKMEFPDLSQLGSRMLVACDDLGGDQPWLGAVCRV